MSNASRIEISEGMKTSIIRIYNYRDKNPTGSFYNVYYGEEIAFGNLTRMLLLIDDMMNQMDSPQASVQSRRFTGKAKQPERASMAQQRLPIAAQEVIATFIVKVIFRQGASWQGTLTWIEGEKEVSFRSALEMIKLMDGALPQPEPCKQVLDSKVPKTG